MNKTVGWLATAFILALGTGSAFGQSAEARRHFDRGTEAAKAKSFETALVEFREAVKFASDWPEAFYNLGLMEEKTEKYGEAALSFRRYLHLAPQAADAAETRSLINELEDKAIRNGQTSTDINARLPSGRTLLHHASIQGDIEQAKLLIAKGGDVNAKDNDGNSPLHFAADKGMAALLIANGAIVQAKPIPVKPTASKPAASPQQKPVSKTAAIAVDVNARDGSGQTALHRAVRSGKSELVAQLIANGADIDARDSDGITPLLAASWDHESSIAELLIAKGAKFSADKAGRTPLHNAAETGNKAVAVLLIAKGANVNAKNSSGDTPLHEVVSGWDAGEPRGIARKELAELLIVKGADINAINKDGDGPLHKATNSPGPVFKEVVELLLNKKANVNLRNNYGRTPLHHAADQGDAGVVGLFIDKGADVNAKDSGDVTPLHFAALAGKKDVVLRLIAEGSKINAKNKDRKTPLDYAELNNHRELADWLKKHGAR